MCIAKPQQQQVYVAGAQRGFALAIAASIKWRHRLRALPPTPLSLQNSKPSIFLPRTACKCKSPLFRTHLIHEDVDDANVLGLGVKVPEALVRAVGAREDGGRAQRAGVAPRLGRARVGRAADDDIGGDADVVREGVRARGEVDDAAAVGDRRRLRGRKGRVRGAVVVRDVVHARVVHEVVGPRVGAGAVQGLQRRRRDSHLAGR